MPRKSPQSSGTRAIRIAKDLADMLSAIAEVQGESISEFVDPLLRPQVVAKYAKIKDTYEAIQKLKKKVKDDK